MSSSLSNLAARRGLRGGLRGLRVILCYKRGRSNVMGSRRANVEPSIRDTPKKPTLTSHCVGINEDGGGGDGSGARAETLGDAGLRPWPLPFVAFADMVTKTKLS